MSGDVVIRRGSLADVEALAHHRAAMFRDMGALADEAFAPLVEAARRWYERAIPAGEYVAWVAHPAGRPDEIVAGAGMQFRDLIPRPSRDGGFLMEGRQGLIVNVFTERPWRRRGIAELLMRELLAWARENGVESLVLHASDEGRSLYERLGFVSTNEMGYRGEPPPSP
jgi:GNAT superfamily N-acetyltransferase